MRASYRVTPLLAAVFSLAVLAGSGVMLGFLARDAVRHVTADDRPAVVTDVSGRASRSTFGRQRRERTISFRLEDGTEAAASARSRWLWWPDEGDTVHVHETAPGDWEVSEAFSWAGTTGYGLLFLVPWVIAAFKVEEWVARARDPVGFAARERQARERVRRSLARSRRRRG